MRAERSTVLNAKVRVPRVASFRRERLVRTLDAIDTRIVLLVAPAGSGKTTLLAQLAAADAPSAWLALDSSDGDPASFLRYLEASLAQAIGPLATGWKSEDDALSALERWPGQRLYLFMDDLHTIVGTPTEAMLERFLRYAPPNLVAVLASRTAPGLDLSRLRLTGELIELGSDDLRFRSWEVERLFRDFYAEPLPPEAIAELSRRTDGWAAGIQLFHLATSGKPLRDRREILSSFGQRSRLIREYLGANVLASLPGELRDFLLETCVLERLSGPSCDRLTGGSDGERTLRELEQRQIFTSAVDDSGNYRYHEVLRAFLESSLVETIGEEEVCRRYLRAAELLEAEGALPEALRAYSRGGDKEAVARLLGRGGEELALDSSTWIDMLPAALRRSDPWLLLASAREHRASGRFTRAIADYRDAERAFGSAPGAQVARGERLGVSVWLDPLVPTPADWPGIVRTATMKEPHHARTTTAGSADPRLMAAGGIGALLAGRVHEARGLLAATADDESAGPVLVAGARLAAAVALLLSGEPAGAEEVARAGDDAERLGVLWLARIGRAALALGDDPSGLSEATAVRMACERRDDPWGSALAALFHGWGALRRGEAATAPLERAADGFRALGAGTLEAWARAALALALARAGDAGAKVAAVQAEAGARLQSVPAAQAVAHLALAELEPERAADHRALAQSIESDCGIALPVDRSTEVQASAEAPMAITCFGGFTLTVGGRPIDLGNVRPRARRALRLLAVHTGHALHREVLVEALWPEVDIETGTRNLQVAISSLRNALEAGGATGAPLIVRDGDAYRLALPAGAEVDVEQFGRALLEGAAARRRDDLVAAASCYTRALEHYAGDLLPEEGPSEWIVGERDHRRSEAGEAAQILAEISIQLGDPDAAARACEVGVRIDRYRDELWRLAVAAYERAGKPAAAARMRRRYVELLAELGIEPTIDVVETA